MAQVASDYYAIKALDIANRHYNNRIRDHKTPIFVVQSVYAAKCLGLETKIKQRKSHSWLT